MKSRALIVLVFVLVASCFVSCDKKGDKLDNSLPDTKLIYERISLTGDNRLNSVVRLSWYGTDLDGIITGFEYSVNNIDWIFTTSQDTSLRFDIPAGQDTADISFFVRAIDDQDGRDETPASLTIPIKNTPPVVSLNEAGLPPDTINLVSTFQYTASDNDGDATITAIEVKLNSGGWVAIPRNGSIFSILPDNPEAVGATTAKVRVEAQEVAIDGLALQGANILYIRAIDNAGSISVEDTSNLFFVKNKTNDLLFITGHEPNIHAEYQAFFANAGIAFDLAHYGRNSGALQPRFWNPNFNLLIGYYDRLFIATSGRQYQNSVTNQLGEILEFGSVALQEYVTKGGKYFVTTRFSDNVNVDAISGVLPMEGLVQSPGQIRISPDSLVFSPMSAYPTLQCRSIVLGPDPFVLTSDAEVLYRANFLKQGGWSGDNVVAALRRNQQGRIFQVFMSLQLHELDKDETKVVDLIKQVLDNDFNW